MFTSLGRTVGFRSVFLFCLLWLTLLCAPAARAQMGGTGIDSDPSSGMRTGRNTIVGQVVYPSGRQTDKRCTVRLSSVRVGEFSTMTDDNGIFTFRRLREGSYFITVEAGKDFLPTSQTVDLYDNSGRTTTVEIQLRARAAPTSKASVINAALAGVPRAAVELYQQGIASSVAGDDRKAAEQLKAAIALYPQFVLALNELSAAYMNLGELSNAEEALVAALKHQPDNPTLRFNYGYVLLLSERFAESERELRRAVQLKDNSPTAHSYLGLLLIRVGRLDEAEKELLRATNLGGSSGITAHRYLGGLYEEKGEIAKAIAELGRYLELAPNAKDAERVRAKMKALQDRASAPKNEVINKPPN